MDQYMACSIHLQKTKMRILKKLSSKLRVRLWCVICILFLFWSVWKMICILYLFKVSTGVDLTIWREIQKNGQSNGPVGTMKCLLVLVVLLVASLVLLWLQLFSVEGIDKLYRPDSICHLEFVFPGADPAQLSNVLAVSLLRSMSFWYYGQSM